jgi:hypothetical protein
MSRGCWRSEPRSVAGMVLSDYSTLFPWLLKERMMHTAWFPLRMWQPIIKHFSIGLLRCEAVREEAGCGE